MPTFEDTLAEWLETKQAMSKLQAQERKLRKSLFDAAFPNPKEGTNSLELADGRIFKGKYPMNRSVDETAVGGVIAELRKLGNNEVVPEDIFPVKHSLSTSVYRKLPEDVLQIVNNAITTKPGSVSIEVV